MLQIIGAKEKNSLKMLREHFRFSNIRIVYPANGRFLGKLTLSAAVWAAFFGGHGGNPHNVDLPPQEVDRALVPAFLKARH